MTDISEVEYTSEANALLCEWHRIVLTSDGHATSQTKKCRMASSDDRRTFCEIKRGSIYALEFGRLGSLLESNGFFDLDAEYLVYVTHGGKGTTRVTRGGTAFQVVNYATAGPMALWTSQQAIEGVAAAVDWSDVSEQPNCPGAP